MRCGEYRACGSGIVSSAADVLWMRGVGKVWEMCMGLSRGGVWMRGLGLGCSGVGGEWLGGLDQGMEGWCYVCVRWGSGLSVYCAW